MTTQILRPLCAIEIRHGYFADGTARHLRLRPTKGCARQLHQCRLHWESAPRGGRLHWWDSGRDLAASGTALGRLLAGTPPLRFLLETDDPDFAACTAGAFAWEQGRDGDTPSLAYFANLRPEADGDGVRLHPDGAPWAEILPCHAPARIPTDGDPRVRDGSGAVVEAGLLQLAHGGSALDLRTLPEGRFRVEGLGGDPIDAWWSARLNPRAIGVVELFPGGPDSSIPAALALLDETRRPVSPPRRFTIALGARQTRWRYVLVAASVESTDEWSLSYEDGARRVGFTEAPATRVLERPARVFESAEPLPLSDAPPAQARVVLHRGAGVRPLLLPYGTVTGTRLEAPRGEESRPRVVTEVFAYTQGRLQDVGRP